MTTQEQEPRREPFDDWNRADPKTKQDRLASLAFDTVVLVDQSERLAAAILNGFRGDDSTRSAAAMFDRMERHARCVLETIAELRASASMDGTGYPSEAVDELRLRARRTCALLTLRNIDHAERLLGCLVQDVLDRVVYGEPPNTARGHVDDLKNELYWFLKDFERIIPGKKKRE